MVYLVNSKKAKRNIIRTVLFILGIACLVFASYTTWYIFIPGLYILIMIPFINDLKIIVYSDRFEIKCVSIINQLSSRESFYYKDIDNIKFDESFTNVWGAIVDRANLVTNIKPDTIELFFKDGNWRSISRIGSKNEFKKACEIMIEMKNKLNSK